MLISCLSASFKNLFYFLSIIIIHEIGHLSMGLFFGWKLDKIYLYPYGGMTVFNEDINKRIIEELLILLNGPIFQIIYFFLFKDIFNNQFTYYQLTILLFNLLPIYPLDGGRILNLLFNYLINYRFSYYLSILSSFILSFIFIYLCIINKYTLNIIFIFILLITKIIKEYKKRSYYFNKFILERYLNKYDFKKMRTISSIKKMMRDKKHIIYDKNRYYTEKEYLNKLYRSK